MLNNYEKGLIYNFRQLGCNGLADRLDNVFSSKHVTSSELLSVLTNATEEEFPYQKKAKAERLLKQAGLLNAYANLDLLEFLPERNLDKVLIDRMSSCSYIDECINVVITGAAGTGKTFLSKALAVQACNEGYRTRIFNLRAMLKDLSIREAAGSDAYARRLRMLANVPLLIIDEWFSITPSKTELVILHELIDERYGRHPTIICSQMPSANWSGYCTNKALGESITGRILSRSYSIELQGNDIRKRHFERP